MHAYEHFDVVAMLHVLNISTQKSTISWIWMELGKSNEMGQT